MATKLLDISFWQDTLDFAKIKKAGYDNIILRAGYGTTIDSKFNEYAAACKKNNINIVAVYWFIYATNFTEVKANANKCLEVIKAYKPKIVFADFEYDTINKAAKKGVKLGAKECDSFTIEFCETVKKAGYTPGYYANTDYYKNMYSSVKNNGLTAQANYLKSHCSYTENMLNMLNVGFEIVARNQTAHAQMQKGDLELNVTHHVAMAIDRDNIVHARSSEGTTNTIDDSGNEIRTQPWYNYSHGWTHRLRFTGKGLNLSNIKPSQTTYNKWVGATTKDGTDVFSNPTGTSKLSTYPKLNKGNLVDVIGVSGTRYQVKIADKFVGYVEKSNIKDPNAIVTKPSASTSKPVNKTYPFVGEVTASELNVRTGAGTNYGKLSSYPILKRGNLVDVLKVKKDTSGNKWYQVRIADKYTGYVSAQYIKKK